MRQFKVTAEMVSGKTYEWRFDSSVEADKMKMQLLDGPKWLEYKDCVPELRSAYIRTDHISEVRVEMVELIL